ncbi:hypothetical protein MLD38_013194 [Melastoma candidum]|uniref:Uncharacterized protein n=1 Tax=Melastoma candidum TaxID=119954 RepID=A0ACB9R8S4_9MYRT|nr:hypothetical protein MLD38_013194 [Melastoma candidum]
MVAPFFLPSDFITQSKSLDREMGPNKPCLLLILVAGMERFAYKGVASNLVTYLTDVMRMSNSSAAKVVSSWCGLTSILPLLIAPLADSYNWDRYSTVLGSSSFYVLGLMALTSTALASALSDKPTTSSAFLFLSLCLISFGIGGYSPSLQAFASDQLENNEDDGLPTTMGDKQKPDRKSPFFQWWYFGICAGSLLGITLMSYVQDEFGWVLGFAIPMGAMVVSVGFLLCGNKFYSYSHRGMDVTGKSFGCVVKVISLALSWLYVRRADLPSEKSKSVEIELEKRPLCQCAFEPVCESPKLTAAPVCENARAVLRLLPVWATLLIYAVICQQPSTFFTKQGNAMDRTVGLGLKMPPATLQSAITLSVILLMPLYDKMLIPVARRVTREETGITLTQRMGIGIFLSTVAMAVAAMVETARLRSSGSKEMSILWLLPQYIIIGVSDVFTVVGMQEYFYREVPGRMRTVGFAMYTGVFGVGSFLSAGVISAVEACTTGRGGGGRSWFDDDMKEAKLDKYYWMLALANAACLFLYISLCKFYVRTHDDDNEGDDLQQQR